MIHRFDATNQPARHQGRYSELDILDLYDDGMTARQIARRRGLTEHYVTKLITFFNADDRRTRERAIAAGSANLLAAITAHHPERTSNGNCPD